MSITETTTVAEIATEYPSSVRVFQRFGIDFCCGGKRPVRTACEQQGIAFDELSQALDEASAAPAADGRDWTQEPLHALTTHIVATYHDALRKELPRLETMAARVAAVHGAKSPALARIEEVVGELSADLSEHMRREELVLFPVIRAAEAGMPVPMPIAAPIAVMEHEHDAAGDLLAELRSLTGEYIVPAWGCATVRALYQGLHELENEMHVHVHLENNVLFPRALRIVGGRQSAVR
jgi:regulator of cell morphogenesis and NO signaling